MRPVGVTIIAVLTWIRGAFYVVIGLVLLVVGHLSARLVSTMATDSFFETLFSRVGKALGFGALLIAVVYIIVGTRLVAAEEPGPDGNGCTGMHLAGYLA